MKKITFVYPQMVMGGAEKAMIRMMKNINRYLYEVHLCLMREGGELLCEVPDWIQIHYCKPRNMGKDLESCRFIHFVRGSVLRLGIRLARSYEVKSYLTSRVYEIPEDVQASDCVICYTHFNILSMAIGARIHSQNRFFWVHCCFRNNLNKTVYRALLHSYKKVFCVSEFTKDEFDWLFPEYMHLSEVFYNLYDVEEIRTKAAQAVPETLMHPMVCTVARLSEEKGQQYIPEIVRNLLDLGYDPYWYLVGDGPTRNQVCELIKKYRVENHVVVLGNQDNPFPYIGACDVYVQPSSYEGYCTTVLEAQVLYRPIIVTEYKAAREQIDDGMNGLIVPRDVPAMTEAVVKLLQEPELAETFSAYWKGYRFADPTEEINRLYRCIEDEEADYIL